MRKLIARIQQYLFATRTNKDQFAALCIATPFLFAGSLLQQPKVAHSEEEDRPVIVLTQNSYLTYHEMIDGAEAGWYYDLINTWAQSNNVELEFRVYDTSQDILKALRAGEGDIALAPFEVEDSSFNDLNAGPPIDTIHYNLICKKEIKDIDSTEQPLRILFPPSASTYKAVEKELQDTNHFMSFHSQDDAMSLLRKVSDENYDCGVVNSMQTDHNIRFFHGLKIKRRFKTSSSLGWLIAADSSDLNQSLWDWISQFQEDERWSNIWRRYFDYQHALNRFETMTLQRRMKTRLPRYMRTFKAAAKHYSLPWELVAAVSYQESHWTPDATSYTGVRGIMQLTNNTAEYLGVENRLDAGQSIWGGAKYLRLLLERTPISAHPRDRLAMALGAYNVGWGHIEDVMQMAQERNKDPNSWDELKELLPLLAKEEYHSKTRYGYARGWEPVNYVERIQNYYDLISGNAIQ